MGLLSGILGNASEAKSDIIEKELKTMLIDGEAVEKAYKLIRDLIIVTNRRLIVVDKQGVTGKKVDYLTVPFSKINRFSKESAGTLDLDQEMKIWVNGKVEPLAFKFKRDANIDDFYRVLSKSIL
ncbi:PH domain-containing protein [Haloplasma contractile]|uniref:Bacterial Pleckstrin homology domain-containing protein n=1 Tax=Haloplasma contractile SSD-17B TaxID=1033810 RepID=U2E9A4_9MOLU|nr:PH domain-containing protein [Haloplasma contractile]ERJ11441.1 hypothetical protein HLPCO_002563 [Haloplasma contractile SSD-17B]